MNNNVNKFQKDDWIDDLPEIQNELSKTEVEEIEFLCKDYLQGELIPGSFKFCSNKFFKSCAKFDYQLLLCVVLNFMYTVFSTFIVSRYLKLTCSW